MKIISPKTLEPFAWMLENFGTNNDPEITVRNAIASHHGDQADEYWNALQLYIQDKIQYQKNYTKQLKN